MPIPECPRCFLFLIFFLPNLNSQAQPDTLRLQTLEQKARANYGQSLDSSLYYARQILLTPGSDQVPAAYGFALNWTGICYMLKGEPDSAEYYYQKTIAYGLAHDEQSYILKARLNRSINYYQQGLFEEALEAGYESLKAFEALGDSLGVAHAQYNIGNSLFQLGRHGEAKAFYRAALPVYLRKDQTLSISNTYNALGSVYKEEAQPDSALYYFKQSAGNKINVGAEQFCAAEYINIGNTYAGLGRTDSARLYLRKGLRAATARGDRQKVATAWLDLASLYNGINQPDSALYYGRQAHRQAQEIGDNYLVKESLFQRARAQAALGNYAKAYRQLEAYRVLHDSLSGAEVEKKAVALEKRYQLEKKEKQLLEQKLAYREKEAALEQQVYLSVVLALVVVVIIVLFYYFHKRQQLRHRTRMDEERRRIAMDLHDYVGAELTLVSSGLDTRVYKMQGERDKEMLGQIADQVRQVNKVLRETVWSIREETITIDQLLEKIRDFTAKFGENRELSVYTSTRTGQTVLPPQVALTLYRICQEAATNTYKYARASRLNIELNKQGHTLTLVVHDDGTGFDTSQPAKGYGLANMRQRAAQLGAEISITSEPGRGATVRVEVPLA